jgi:hypothetical protein
MADARYRGCSIFAGTKRVAEMMDVDYEILSNDETVYADVPGGVAGYTDGAVEVSITASGIMPVRGSTYNFENNIIPHAYIDIGIGIVNGNDHQTRGRVMRAKFTSNVKTGELKGEFQLRAFAPSFAPSGLQ